MKAQDLRIGNYYMYGGQLLIFEPQDFQLDFSKITPIPLAIEWLDTFGIENWLEGELQKFAFNSNNWFSNSIHNDDTPCWMNDTEDYIRIDYVHELQDMWKLYNREELTKPTIAV